MSDNSLLAFLITFIILDALISGFWICTIYCYHRDCYRQDHSIDLSNYNVNMPIRATELIKNTMSERQLIHAPLHITSQPLPPNYTEREWKILKWVLCNQTVYRPAQDFNSRKKIILDRTLGEICVNTQATKKDIDYLVEIGRGITMGKYLNLYSIPILIQTNNYRFHVEETN